ncbi:vesicle-associated protein 1-2-like isoform X1 [Typha latifolia]|uniref:vesicle-associated protein 1-2-like isoform X1 n=1 Tax=Typha latifolia TaxID=4733 RepID=UPI003C2C1CCB
MSTKEILAIEPVELKFPFELKKQISCSLQLLNKTDEYVAFKVKTTSPKKYCVRPNAGIVLPRSTCGVIGMFYLDFCPKFHFFFLFCSFSFNEDLEYDSVTMQAQREAPPDMQCKDKFLVQSVIVKEGAMVQDITPEMFTKESGNVVDEVKLRVVYAPPPQPPSPVPEGSEEGTSPRASVSDNGNLSSADLTAATIAYEEHEEKSSEATTLISRLTEEKSTAIQQNKKLRQELDLLRREVNKQRGGFSFIFVVIVVLLGIILGYLVKT